MNPLNLVPADERDGTGGKIVGRANAGQSVYIGVSLADARHHMHVLGPTGTGKSSLLLELILQDADTGRGVAVFDPKGDLINDVLDRLPADCGDRLVIIDPDETVAPPALNLLAPTPGVSPYDVAAHVSSVMSKVWSRWWGHRTADIAHHALLTLAHTEGSTLAHLPRLLSDAAWRAGKVAAVRHRVGPWEATTLGEFWDGFEAATPGQRATLTAPLLAKLRLVLAHPLAAGLFGIPQSTFSLPDILNGGILLVRLPKGIVGEDGCRLIGSLLLAGLWQATTARARIPETQRLDCAIYVDECHNFLHLPIGLDDALAEARGLRTSFVLAHQYLGQLTDDMAQAIDANARNKVYFALAPRDARDQARHVEPYLDEGDLMRMGGFEVVLRPVAKGRTIPPSTADTLAPEAPVRGRASQLRQEAREWTGLPEDARRRFNRDANSPKEPDDSPQLTVAPGRNTFALADPPAGSESNEESNERSHVTSNDHEHASEQPPLDTEFWLFSDDEEDPWTGTD